MLPPALPPCGFHSVSAFAMMGLLEIDSGREFAAPMTQRSVPSAGAGRTASELAGITKLGSQGTRYTFDYDPGLLEVFDNKHPQRDYFVKFNCPEFTSLCPMTGQPDFATLYISYIPDVKMVESKSLKLYLFSFRNHGDFHEDCVNIIMNDLIRVMDPRYIEVWGKFTPRGGISIDPYCNYGRPGTRYEEMARYRLMNHDLYPEKVDNR
jgi:7-cyano-7-deazaguanine reductase